MSLCQQRGACLLSPNLKCHAMRGPVAVGRHSMASWVELSIDERVRRQEALGPRSRLEALHLLLPTPRWSM